MTYKYNFHYVCVNQDNLAFGTLLTIPANTWPWSPGPNHPIWKLFKITEYAGSV